MNLLTIVMYHYVRPIAQSDYPAIKGLELSDFVLQLDYIQKYFNPVSVKQVIDAKNNIAKLPEKAILLTFDDGYIDHFEYVYPLLKQRGISGAFYPPTDIIRNRKVLDVNKVHYILASTSDSKGLVLFIHNKLKEEYGNDSDELIDKLKEKFYKKNKWENEEVNYVKKLLQNGLEDPLRKTILDELFNEVVGVNEEDFASSLYMNIEHLREMSNNGMHIGGHGMTHSWMDIQDVQQQEKEILESKDMLLEINSPDEPLTFCYPYGRFNTTTLELLKKHQFELSTTTEVKISSVKQDTILQLPRLDTNHLPKDPNREMIDISSYL